MKKILFILMISTLVGCASHEEPSYAPEIGGDFRGDVKTEIEIVPPENIVLQPDEQIQELQQIDVPVSIQTNAQEGNSMDFLAKELRTELRGTGILIREVAGQIDLIVTNKIAFGSNQMNFQNTFQDSMTSIAKLLKKYDQTMIQIIGYTDEKNSVLENKETSLQRAEVVANFLKEHGIEAGRIMTDGAGGENPVATNLTPAGRDQNRRIEMTFISLR